MVNLEHIQKIRKRLDDSMKRAYEDGLMTKELRKKQIENDDRIAKSRGEILNRMAELEHMLNLYIAYHYCISVTGARGKVLAFMQDILQREWFSLSKKIELFEKIGYHKRKEFNNVYDGLEGVLKSLRNTRNLVAHGFKVHWTRPEMSLLHKKGRYLLNRSFMQKFSSEYEIAFISISALTDALAGISDIHKMPKKKRSYHDTI